MIRSTQDLGKVIKLTKLHNLNLKSKHNKAT